MKNHGQKLLQIRFFPAINEELFSVLYSSKASRPNTPVNVIVGALILKEALGDSDDELVEALMFDIRYEAAKHGIRLITTNFTGVKPADIFAEFIFSKDRHELLECINHKSPYTFRYDEHNDRCAAIFKKSDCIECPYLAECKPRLRQNSALKELSWKAVNRAKQLRFMKTEEFKQHAHFRNGVEALPSLLRRKYHSLANFFACGGSLLRQNSLLPHGDPRGAFLCHRT